MLVREAILEDAEAIARVDVESHQAAYFGLLPPDYLALNTIESGVPRWRRIISGEAVDRAPPG
jgi:hypothetical protein